MKLTISLLLVFLGAVVAYDDDNVDLTKMSWKELDHYLAARFPEQYGPVRGDHSNEASSEEESSEEQVDEGSEEQTTTESESESEEIPTVFTWDNFKKQIIKQHNKYRRELGVGIGDLTWDDTIAEYAQEGSDMCVIAHRDQTGNKIRYGENLYGGGGPAKSAGKDAVDSWYEEKMAYTYGVFEWDETKTCNIGMKYTVMTWGHPIEQVIDSCGHYTQLIWKTTTKVGCGFTDCGDKKIVVCDYYPPGNYMGRTPY